jgi:hypothetical protein
LLFASKARYGPIPLRLAYLGRSAGSVLRSLRRLWGVRAFALCARGFGDRFQGSLRTDPAPLGVLGDRLPGWSRGIGIGAGGQLRMNWACIRA